MFCLAACLSARIFQKQRAKTKVSLPADHGRWRRCDMLSTSGFVDHAVLAHSGQEINIGDAKMTYGQSDSAVEI